MPDQFTIPELFSKPLLVDGKLGDLRLQETPPTQHAATAPDQYADDDGQWITIGGHASGDEQHVGGFHVKIDGEGKIVAGGTTGLHGKHISEVKETLEGVRKKSAGKPTYASQEEYDEALRKAYDEITEGKQNLPFKEAQKAVKEAQKRVGKPPAKQQVAKPPSTPALDLKDPAATSKAVHEQARSVPDAVRGHLNAGDLPEHESHKPLISDVYDALQAKGQLQGVSLDDFKAALLNARQQVELQPGNPPFTKDTPAGTGYERSKRSETPYLGTAYHTINTNSKQARGGQQPPATREEYDAALEKEFKSIVGDKPVDHKTALKALQAAKKKIGESKEPAKPEQPPTSASKAVDLNDTTSVAKAVHEAGRSVPDVLDQSLNEGNRPESEAHKPLISDVYESLKAKGQLGNASLDDFKAGLLKAWREGKIELNRLDENRALTNTAEGSRKQERSEIPYLTGTYHTINTNSKQARGGQQPPAQHATDAPTQYARDNLPDPDMELWQEVLYVVPANRPASLPHECGVVKGLKVFLVDGNEIKLRDRKGDKNHKGDDSFMEFVEGGNGREDSELCGPDEVYLDANLDPVCYPFVCYHECQESADMKGGMTYDQAHERANHAEKILRERFPDPWKEE